MVDVLPVYWIISLSINKYPVVSKLADESTVTLVAEAVIPLPSFTAVVAAAPDIPPHMPAPQPVPYELSSSPTFI